VPTDDEWKTLEMYLGMTQLDADATSWRATYNEGGKLKETDTTHWVSPNTGASNSNDFTALPGGCRWGGSFYWLERFGYWWQETESDEGTGWNRHLGYNTAEIWRGREELEIGYSVRCLRD